jgi:predicted transposase YbfD/YdcC
LATEEKSNEITAIPDLLEQIEIRNAVMSIDAAGGQKSIASKNVSNKGDYVLAVKGIKNYCTKPFKSTLCNKWKMTSLRRSLKSIKRTLKVMVEWMISLTIKSPCQTT